MSTGWADILKDPKYKDLTPERKMEAFLTHLALTGIAGSTEAGRVPSPLKSYATANQASK